MSKVLDLDGIAPPKRTVKIFGEEHALEPMSLRSFVKYTREVEELRKAIDKGEKGEIDLVESNLDSLKYLLPGLSDEKLGRLTPEQVVAIMTWAQETAASGAPDEASAKDASSGN